MSISCYVGIHLRRIIGGSDFSVHTGYDRSYPNLYNSRVMCTKAFSMDHASYFGFHRVLFRLLGTRKEADAIHD